MCLQGKLQGRKSLAQADINVEDAWAFPLPSLIQIKIGDKVFALDY